MQISGVSLRSLPAVSRLLDSAPFRGLIRAFGAPLVTSLTREALGHLRSQARSDGLSKGDLSRSTRPTVLADAIRREAETLLRPRPRRVINATGVVLHTNLGRSILSAAAANAVADAAQGYLDLEYDVDVGRRGSRQDHLQPLLGRLFPGFDAFVVNNNAAATTLCLRAHAKGKEVIVSRGELVEIGGSFRVPEILQASGARLKEVGTTNRTRLQDYREAVGTRTGALLKVHTSNFKIIGFTEEAPLESLVALAEECDVPLIVDWGSGDLVDLGPVGIHDELPVKQILAGGADLVSFSGDKLLGGAQAGFIVGKARWMERVRKDPMARAFRIDRLRVAALHATLSAYVRNAAMEEIPTLRMLALSSTQIGRRAERIRTAVRRKLPSGVATVEVVDGESRPGGGSSPLGRLPTRLLAVRASHRGVEAIEADLRACDPPIVARVREDRLLLDLRTVDEADDVVITAALQRLLAQ